MTASVSVPGQITVVGDSAVALLLGLTAGILCYFSNFSETYLAWMAFSKEFFFYGAKWPGTPHGGKLQCATFLTFLPTTPLLVHVCLPKPLLLEACEKTQKAEAHKPGQRQSLTGKLLVEHAVLKGLKGLR